MFYLTLLKTPACPIHCKVLETCVKNCGYRFHILVTTREFVEGVLVRSIIPRNNPPLVVHDRVLSIVQVQEVRARRRMDRCLTRLLRLVSAGTLALPETFCILRSSLLKAWADAFRSSPDLTGVVSVYEDLRRKGLEFPMTELNGYTSAQPQQKVPRRERRLHSPAH